MITFEHSEERMVWAMAAQGSLTRNGDTDTAMLVADKMVLGYRERERKRDNLQQQQQQQQRQS